jgi:hypothetical protein
MSIIDSIASAVKPRRASICARALAALTLALLPLAATSCHDARTNTAVPIDGRRMVVIPMRDPVSYYFESPVGTRLAELISDHLEETRKDNSDCVNVVPFEDLKVALRDVNPKNMRFTDIARRVKADMILVGNITTFDTHLAGDIGLVRGKCNLEIMVLETAHPERPILRNQYAFTFPPENYHTQGFYTPDQGSEEDVKAGLLALATKKISQLFYAHDAADEK